MGANVNPHLRGCWVKFGIDLHPSRSDDVLGGVKEQLNGLLLRYNEDLEGVVLSYSKERILSTQAKIHPYFPYFHVDVAALVFIFQPVPGAAITGVVNAIGHDYIGVLVLGIFNAVVGRAHIPAHIQCRPLESCWSSSRDRHSRIEAGSELHFAVQSVDHATDFFTLSGSLLETDLQQATAWQAATQQQKPAPISATVPAASRYQPDASARRQADDKRQQLASSSQQPAAAGRVTDAGADGSSADVARLAAPHQSGHPQPSAPSAAAAAAAPAAAATAGKQPEHRKKNKRRDKDAESAGLANGHGTAVQSPKKKKKIKRMKVDGDQAAAS